MSEVYLDANAGMPLRPEARGAMLAAMDALPGNPSSPHAAGRRVRRILSEAREAVAALAGARPAEVVFTSGATEANLLALRGALAAAAPGRTGLVTTRAEHASVARAAQRLAETGTPVRLAPVDRFARAAPDAVTALCDGATALVSVVLGQSVTGALQPVPEIGASLPAGVALHTDAAQAAGRVPLDVRSLRAALLSLSSSKLGGPPGVGALVVREGARWRNPDGEFAQEAGRRPGTEAVVLVAGFGAAAAAALREIGTSGARDNEHAARIRTAVASIGGRVESPVHDVLPNTVLASFDGCPGDAVVAALDAEGIRVSTGSACASLARLPEPALLAGGRLAADAARAVRISVSWSTSAADVDRFLAALPAVVGRVRHALTTG